MKSIVVLISGSGSNLQAIIDQIHTTRFPAKISAVISNKANAFGLQRAQNAGIATHVIPFQKGQAREEFDRQIAEQIDAYQPDLVVLAGYMRILSDDFVYHYRGKLINIHPSLLPDFKGLHTHQRALDAGVKQHGASVHFVIPALDEGPVIIQGKVDVEADDSAESLQQKVHKQEHIIYPQAIKWFCEGRLSMLDNRVYFDNKELNIADLPPYTT
ncbi:phosphoribosylglycinamide formyltransferase [Alteromonas sp. a30]|uniref:phosphoribosylglycinamide formyltransferase n=1 Tax=Alteromonas sp. a30 TaxID=2730917 RepID=UPI00227E0E47|nr:phosphoribosylglycinamide formyltransferase [Alteromonas sp. a30]MCY7294111.1 phosphoribosylglycinamide formyltransferase [Alteromonas sp. a30]